MITIKFLKAGSGDSILIQDGTNNILIDGGNDFTYVRDEIKKIQDAGQRLNLVVVTHHDDDHISGIINLMKAVNKGDFGDNFVEKVFVNTPRKILGKISSGSDQSLSYKQAHQLEELLYSNKCIWEIVNSDTSDEIFGKIRFRFLSPVQDDLEKYSLAKGAYLTSDFRCDWDASMAALEPFISDESQDNSGSNKTSIVILIEFDNKRILLTGDCIPERLNSIMDELVKEDPLNPYKLEFVKLPHHGSYRSLSKSFLSKIDCSKFIISTNGSRHFLPNKRAILKVVKYLPARTKETEFLFNYSEPISNLKISPAEKKKYRIRLTANNETYGLSI